MKKFHWYTLAFFAIIYCLISLVNHYNFRTYGLDLGIETNAAYDYAHFGFNECTIMYPHLNNFLSDHFSVTLIFISPIIYLFGTYGLLIAQIAALLTGGWGIFKYVMKKTGKLFIANLALIHFLGFWGIFSALLFDYHNNVIGAMAVPWLFYFIECRKIKPAIAAFCIIILSKENMALWAFFLCTGMLFIYRRDKQLRMLLIILSGMSAVYFLTVMFVIIPALANPGHGYSHLQFQSLGTTFGEMLRKMISEPGIIIDLHFKTHSVDPMLQGIKFELHKYILLAGGITLLYRPIYAWMLLPVYAQKLFNDDPAKWGVGYHYNIEFAPILTIVVIEFINAFSKNEKFQKTGISVFVLSTLISTASIMDRNHSLNYNYTNVRFYQKKDYLTKFDRKKIQDFIDSVPDDVSVSASMSVAPHLTFRKDIYTLPDISTADYIVILKDGNYYPLNTKQTERLMDSLSTDNKYETFVNDEWLFAIKRK
jgi:uncharacterized membrane protein